MMSNNYVLVSNPDLRDYLNDNGVSFSDFCLKKGKIIYYYQKSKQLFRLLDSWKRTQRIKTDSNYIYISNPELISFLASNGILPVLEQKIRNQSKIRYRFKLTEQLKDILDKWRELA